MASSTAILSVRIIGDAKKAVKSFNDTSTASSRMGGAIKKIGTLVAGASIAAGSALAGIAVAGIKGAGDLEQSVGALDAVFGKSAKAMHQYASNAQTSLGLTKNSYNELATLMGTQLKNGMGGASADMGAVGAKTQELIGLGADLASMFGGSTADAVGALSSALKGERNPIERYGVALKQAQIDAKAAEMGFKKVGGSISAEANQAATLALIMEQTSAAHGNFSRESDTFAHQIEVGKAQIGNLVTTIGQAFLPTLTNLGMAFTTTIMPGVQNFADSVIPKIGGAVNQLAPVFKPLINVFTSFISSGVSPLQLAFKTLQPFFPIIGKIFTSIGTLITGTLIPAFAQIAGAIMPLLQTLIGVLLPPILSFINAIIPAIGTLINALTPLFGLISEVFIPAIESMAPFIGQVFEGLTNIVIGAVDIISGVVNTFIGIFTGNWSGAWEGIKTVFSGVWTSLGGIIQTAWNTLSASVAWGMAMITKIWNTAWASVWNGIKTAVSTAFNSVVSVISTGVTNSINFIKELPSRAVGALANIGQALLNCGKALIQGFIDGIKSMFSALWDTVSNLASSAVSSVKSALGIASPSKVFTKIGKQTGQGLIIGLNAMQTPVSKAMASLANIPALSPLTPALSLETGPVSSVGARAGNVINISVNGALDPVAVAQQIKTVLTSASRRLSGVTIGA